MKISTLVVCSASLLVPAAAFALHAYPPRAGLALQDRYQELKTKLKPAVAVKNYDEVTKLLKSYQEEAVGYVDDLAATMASANSEEVEREFQMLSKCWKEAFKSEFVQKLYDYHSMLALDAPRRKERFELLAQYRTTMQKFDQNRMGPKEGPGFEVSASEFAAMSDGFAKIGDFFYAARCAGGVAICYDVTYRENEADLKKTCEWFGKAVEHFDKVDLKYSYYHQCKQRWEGLLREGHGPEAPADPNSPTNPNPTAQPSAALTVATAFEALESLDEVQRPIYNADEIYAIWPIVPLGAKGSSGTFQALEKGPLVLRPDSSKVALDFDRDGNADKPIPITGNFTTVDFELGEGEEKRRWAFMFKTGIQQDVFQGLQTNLQPDDLQMRFYVLNAGSVVAQVNGVPVRVIDDNMDGVYGSPPKTYAYAGLAENVYQPDYDCVVVGSSRRARPWSKYLDVNGSWYEVECQKSGAALKATPLTIETGTLRLDFKGPQPSWVILKGTGKLEGCYFDVVGENKKPVTVPVGVYELFIGEVRQGKKAQTMKSLILPGGDTKKWTVSKGAECVVTMGGPFTFDFVAEAGTESVTVKGKSVTVYGAARERYERMWNCVPRPDISWRKAGTKKGSKPEKMHIVLDLLEQTEDGKYRYTEADTWRPIDTAVPIKAGESVEVQLVEKKNKLFGEIQSEWK